MENVGRKGLTIGRNVDRGLIPESELKCISNKSFFAFPFAGCKELSSWVEALYFCEILKGKLAKLHEGRPSPNGV